MFGLLFFLYRIDLTGSREGEGGDRLVLIVQLIINHWQTFTIMGLNNSQKIVIEGKEIGRHYWQGLVNRVQIGIGGKAIGRHYLQELINRVQIVIGGKAIGRHYLQELINRVKIVMEGKAIGRHYFQGLNHKLIIIIEKRQHDLPSNTLELTF